MLEYKSHRKDKISSEKNFGVVFAVFFVLLFFYYIFFENYYIFSFLLIAVIFLFFSYIYPRIFFIPNILWFKIGLILGRIISPIIIIILFYLVISPSGLILKIFNKKLIDKNIDKNKNTYWIKRIKSITTMKNQF